MAETTESRPASIGVGLFPTGPAGEVAELVQLAESLGYENAWIGDSQNIWREAVVTITASLLATKRIVVGSGVTNVVTRHRSVLASAFATLAELAPGRIAVGLGTGDSSVHTMGLKPLSVSEVEVAVEELRLLLRGEEVAEPTSGSAYRLAYLAQPASVPLYVAATGAKLTTAAAGYADGIILAVGTDVALVEQGLARICAGAEAAGRTRDELKVVLWTPAAIDEDGSAARDVVRAHVARSVKRRITVPLPAEEEAAIARIRESYDYYGHMDPRSGHSDLVTDGLVRRFALAGTPDECREQLTGLAGLAEQIAIIPAAREPEARAETMRLFAKIAAEVGTLA
jgi:5,10-methylenetetrahydromethanopterin reductase